MFRPTQDTISIIENFNYRSITFYALVFQLIHLFSLITHYSPTTPNASIGFVLIPVRSPLLWESHLISLPLATEMFHFTRLAPILGNIVLTMLGCPIRKSSDQRSFAPPRSLSQLITSFIASESQGERGELKHLSTHRRRKQK